MLWFLYLMFFFVTTFFQVPGFDGFHDVGRNAKRGVDLAVLGFGSGGLADFQYSALFIFGCPRPMTYRKKGSPNV